MRKKKKKKKKTGGRVREFKRGSISREYGESIFQGRHYMGGKSRESSLILWITVRFETHDPKTPWSFLRVWEAACRRMCTTWRSIYMTRRGGPLRPLNSSATFSAIFGTFIFQIQDELGCCSDDSRYFGGQRSPVTSRPHRINPIMARKMDATLNQYVAAGLIPTFDFAVLEPSRGHPEKASRCSDDG